MDGIGEQALKAADPKAPDQRLIRTETIRRGTDPAPVQKTEENMINIAIDGPAGAGKSTIAKKVAAEKNYIYVDTGAMYRAMALYLLRSGIDREDAAAISAACGKPEITIEYRDGIQVVLLDGENVNEFLSTVRLYENDNPEGDLAAFLEELALYSDCQRGRQSGQKIQGTDRKG